MEQSASLDLLHTINLLFMWFVGGVLDIPQSRFSEKPGFLTFINSQKPKLFPNTLTTKPKISQNTSLSRLQTISRSHIPVKLNNTNNRSNHNIG